jgi:NAD+ kinase
MKVLIYDNKEKDSCGEYLKELEMLLSQAGIEYLQIFDKDLNKKISADIIFTLGGDGTILWVINFANNNNIPIIGINIGKVGFLTEFDKSNMAEAVNLLKDGQLKEDKRLTLSVSVNDKILTCALNDAFIQRVYSQEIGCMTAEISVHIDGRLVEDFKGDGVVICSPTGSTAYSLSVGGSILAPDVDALAVTPIAAHALGLRSIVFSSNSTCQIELFGKTQGALFTDGRLICQVQKGDKIEVKKSKLVTTFLRKKDFNFYKRFSLRLNDRFKG